MSKINEIENVKREKLKALNEAGIYAYGGRFDVDGQIQDFINDFQEGKAVSLAGRLMAVREHGKSVFYDMRDSSGKVQLFAGKNALGDEKFEFLKKLDIGDIVGVKGELFKTRTGEPTLKINEITILSKALKTLPEKWHGLKDVETRYRHRYTHAIRRIKRRGLNGRSTRESTSSYPA